MTFFHKAVSKKIVCSSDLNSTFDTNAWAILKTLFDNLRSNSPFSRKTKTKLSENVICCGSLWERSLSEIIGFPNFTKNGVQTFEQQRNEKNFAVI